MIISHYLRQSLYYTGRQVSGYIVLAEANTATFVGLWDDEGVMALAVFIYLCFLRKNTATIMSNMYAHV